MAARTYDPKLNIVTFNGVLFTGFADGTFIKVSRDEDAYTKKTGADGETARARNRNRGGSVELTLLQTSQGNDLLSAMQNADELLMVGGAGPFMIKDLLGTTLVLAHYAWIKKPADIELGKEISDRGWVLDTGELEVFIGGNS